MVTRKNPSPKPERLDVLLAKIRACIVCAAQLPLGPRPVVQIGTQARLLIVGQAPGTKVHASGVPWDDASGRRLREWLGIDESIFYDASRVAIVPMGFCYPGRGGGGDLPPRPECAPLWFDRVLAQLPNIELTLLIGQYAQKYFLGNRRRATPPKPSPHSPITRRASCRCRIRRRATRRGSSVIRGSSATCCRCCASA
jgi:uracil-DNA glycosylase